MRPLLCTLVLAAIAARSAIAQVGAGQVTGVVRDSGGAPAPGATITATDASRNVTRATVSGAGGGYTLPGLPPGTYRIRVALGGFRPVAREVGVKTGDTVRLDVELAVGTVEETITVTAEVPPLRRGTASLGQVIGEAQVVGLPLNGRSFVTLAAVAPGVALPPGSQLPRINGGRPRTNEYLFDGISVLQPEPGQVAFFPVIDAIQEFKIESNSPPAEFGRFNGGVVNLTTRSGANELRGTAFEFFRDEHLNARNFFSSADPAKPAFRRNQFGGVLGGPIRRNRSFFFVDYQGQRQTIARTSISTVPTIDERRGVLTRPIYDPATTAPDGRGGFTRTAFPGNTIPFDRFDPVAYALLQRYPLPTAGGAANNYRRTTREVDDQDQFDVRADHRLTRDSAFARVSYFRDSFVPVSPLPDGSGVAAGTLGPQDTNVLSVATSYRRTLSDRWFNELRFGDTRRTVTRASAAGNLPTYQISGYQQLGSSPNTMSDFGTGVTEVADALSWLSGRHTVKMGLDFRWERLNVIQPPSPFGLYTFSSLFTDLPGVTGTGSPVASFLLGQVQTFSIDVQPQQIRNRARIQEYFVQDDWKLSDRLTIAPGLRYTLNFPSTEEHDQAAVFNLETERLEYLGRDGQPRSARRLHKNNFGPRLGLVGRVADRTIVGAGYGLVWIEMAGITTPFTTPVFPFLQTVSQRTLDDVSPAFGLARGPTVSPLQLTPDAGLGQGVFAVDRDLGSGYVQQWNVSLQREVATNLSVEVAYIGSKITRVGIPDTNLNQLTVAQLALGPALQQRVANPYVGIVPRSSSIGEPTIPLAQLLKPYPEYTTVSLYRNNVGTTFYKGVTAKLEQRLSRGLSYLISYTRSKLEDDASAVFDASILNGPVANYPVADSFNRKLERDYSTGDIPQVFVSSLTWQYRGWSLAAVITLQSGAPVAVTQATNFNAFAGFGIQRPNLVGDPELPSGERRADRWFNTAAFAVAPAFTLGSSSRNPVRGPAYRNVDVALSRRFHLGPSGPGRDRSGFSLEVRAEVFNLLNTPALGVPAAVLGAANFGTIVSAGDPRVAQLAAKLLF